MFFWAWLCLIIATCFVADRKNLGIVSYLVFSIFLGPIALIVALLSPSKKAAAFNPGNISSLEEAQRQLDAIKESFFTLQKRIVDLERNISRFTQKETASLNPLEQDRVPTQSKIDFKIPQETTQEAFELIFGKYWLSRIGVVIFVLGVAFFISYTFQYLSAFIKIAIGYLLAISFLVLGHSLEKKQRYRKVAWGILGGGWGLLYLSTYAMHYIDVTRIVSSATLELLLLTAVSLLTIVYNLKYNSWIVTAMTFLLVMITVGLGGINYSTIFYWTLLIGGICYLAYQLNWYKFLLLGITSAYITYLCWIYPNIHDQLTVSLYADALTYRSQISFGLLMIAWILFTCVLLFLRPGNDREKVSMVIGGHLMNAASFAVLGVHEIYRVVPDGGPVEVKFWFVTFLSLMYFILGYCSRTTGGSRLIVANVSIAFCLLGWAIFIKAPRLGIGFLWILEMSILFILGVYYKESMYRLLAWLLSFLVMIRLFVVDLYSQQNHAFLGVYIQHNILIWTLASICFYILGVWLNNKNVTNTLPEEEANWYNLFPVFGMILMIVLLTEEVTPRWLSLSWTLEGMGLLALGFFVQQRIFRLCALCVLSLAALRVIFFDLIGINTIYKIIAFIFLGVVLLGVSLVYSRFMEKRS